MIWYSNCDSHSLNHRALGGRVSRDLLPGSGTSCLWPISMVIALPNIYDENFSHAQVIARASFLN